MKIYHPVVPVGLVVMAVGIIGIAIAQDAPTAPRPILPPAEASDAAQGAKPAEPTAPVATEQSATGAAAEPAPAAAQPSAPASEARTRTSSEKPASTTPAGTAAPTPTGAQLEQLVAPVALYPDPLLSQLLMASTHPLEVVAAAHWIAVPANRALKGDALTEALKPQNWDPSILALVPFPRVLAMMSEHLAWTRDLGNAYRAEQAAVTQAVQTLRQQALAAGTLRATPDCHCVINTTGGTVSIVPVNPQLVCIPTYTPTVAYGASYGWAPVRPLFRISWGWGGGWPIGWAGGWRAGWGWRAPGWHFGGWHFAGWHGGWHGGGWGWHGGGWRVAEWRGEERHEGRHR